MYNQVKEKFEMFVNLAEKEVEYKPWLVVILMHEYYRNLYPEDSYIPFSNNNELPLERVSKVLDYCINSFNQMDYLGSYFINISASMGNLLSSRIPEEKKRPEEGDTQKVYGSLWDKFNYNDYIKEAREILETRLKHSGLKLDNLKGKKILDLGCGSGRFSIALASEVASEIYGIDLGRISIEKGKEIAKSAGINNIKFEVSNVLETSFEDNYFDFVFCNGVLHHTENLEKGINEIYRVLRPGGDAFLYLYADGGLLWYSREKMPQVMKKIPQKYTMAVLDLLGMPNNRFIFCDNWYVPIERHISKDYLENYLKEVGFTSFKKIVSGRVTDLDSITASDFPQKEEMWGDGEHRYLLKK